MKIGYNREFNRVIVDMEYETLFVRQDTTRGVEISDFVNIQGYPELELKNGIFVRYDDKLRIVRFIKCLPHLWRAMR